jgi:hypothetical protein
MPNGTIMDGPVHGQGQVCVQWADTERSGGNITKKSSGGYLVGPSHEDGGIPVIVDGVEPIEVEGGEFIINKKTVEAVGEDFLHKLNSTSTPYHPPEQGFNQGVLPNPSNYSRGGRVKPNLRRGGRPQPKRSSGRRTGTARRRIMNEGGSPSQCPPGQQYSNGTCVPVITPPSSYSGYKKGGRITRKNRSKFRAGGQLPRLRTSVGISSVGNNHAHSITRDPLTGDGLATGHGHTHKIKNGIMQTYCDEKGNCHSHGL